MLFRSASDQAKLLRWRSESIELPRTFLTSPDAAQFLRQQVSLADSVYFAVRGALAALVAATMPDSKSKDTQARARSVLDSGPAAPTFFSAVERNLPQLMRGIAQGDVDVAARTWLDVLLVASEQAWTATRRCLGDSPAALRAEARVYPKFRSQLRKLKAGLTVPVEEINQ